MKPVFSAMLIVMGLFACQGSSQKTQEIKSYQQIVYFGDEVTLAQRKAAMDTLTSLPDTRLISGDIKTQQFILMSSSKPIPCTDKRIVCKPTPNAPVRFFDPCHNCLRCCIPPDFVIKGDPAPDRSNLYHVLTEIERGRATKTKSIVLSIQVPQQSIKQTLELMQMERLSLTKNHIDLNLILNEKKEFGIKLMQKD